MNGLDALGSTTLAALVEDAELLTRIDRKHLVVPAVTTVCSTRWSQRSSTLATRES